MRYIWSMGTNYYGRKIPTAKDKQLMKELIEQEKWDELQNSIPVDVHIGKQSSGWKFIFNHNDWKYFDDESELSLVSFLNTVIITDEYGVEISAYDFWDIVSINADGMDFDMYYQKYPTHRTFSEKLDQYNFGLLFSTSTNFS